MGDTSAKFPSGSGWAGDAGGGGTLPTPCSQTPVGLGALLCHQVTGGFIPVPSSIPRGLRFDPCSQDSAAAIFSCSISASLIATLRNQGMILFPSVFLLFLQDTNPIPSARARPARRRLGVAAPHSVLMLGSGAVSRVHLRRLMGRTGAEGAQEGTGLSDHCPHRLTGDRQLPLFKQPAPTWLCVGPTSPCWPQTALFMEDLKSSSRPLLTPSPAHTSEIARAYNSVCVDLHLCSALGDGRPAKLLASWRPSAPWICGSAPSRSALPPQPQGVGGALKPRSCSGGNARGAGGGSSSSLSFPLPPFRPLSFSLHLPVTL